MNAIDISKIDLNLLSALELLLTEQSVTRAARRAKITQSSMSHTLRRLRVLFGDPLLVRSGRGVVVTPRGQALLGPLQRALRDLRLLVKGETEFVPASSRRVFVLACPDLLGALLPELLSRLLSEAPKVRLEVRPLPASELAAVLAEGVCDLVLAPPLGESSGLVQRSLGSLSWCVLARRGHPACSAPFTSKVWGRYPHVMVRSGRDTPNWVGQTLAAKNIAREVGLTVPGFLLALYAVACTDFFFTAPRELVVRLAEPLGLVVLPPPVELPSIEVREVWHERFRADPGHRWFRSLVAEIFQRALRPEAVGC